MTGRIPENILEDILNRVDIVEVISGYLPLKRSGRNFKALCPFHHEKTASFTVSADRQIYHCFGCGESGNAFRFLMRYERMEFQEAVGALAKKAGVVLPEAQTADRKDAGISTQLYKINELAGLFYQNRLNSAQGTEARNYLKKRGINDETIRLCGLGLAAEGWDALMNYLRTKNISLSLIEKAGLILPKEGGGYYDRFRGRVIFPVADIKSRIIGFGARVLDKSLPKYINSPETHIYTKGRNLYGLNLAKDSIRENDYVVIVEGYLDFIMPYQEGLKNIVASLGTALTFEQIRLLKRYTRNVVMLYDSDTAGELATLRTLDMFIEEDLEVKVVSLPQGNDPDLFVREKGIENLKAEIRKAQNLFDYKLKILKSRYNFKEIEGKAKISSLMLESINRYKNAVLKSEYIRKLAQELSIKEEALLEEAKKTKAEKPYAGNEAASKKNLNINPVEKLLIKLMLEENRLIEKIKEHFEPEDFQDERISRIISVMFDLTSQGKNIGPNFLMNYFEEKDISGVVSESIFLPEIPSQNKEKAVDDCIQRLKTEKLKLKKQYLHDQIKIAQNSGDEEELRRLMGEFHSLIKKN